MPWISEPGPPWIQGCPAETWRETGESERAMKYPILPMVILLCALSLGLAACKSKKKKAPPPDNALSEYIKRARTTEAVMNLGKIFASARSYYFEDKVSRRGQMLPRQFPASTNWMPEKPCCKYRGNKCAPTSGRWNGNDTWRALQFAMDGEHYYQYKFQSSGEKEEAEFTVTARGDLDCNGVFSTFELQGKANSNRSVTRGSGIIKTKPLE